MFKTLFEMNIRASKRSLYNSFAYRFNKLAKSINLQYTIILNNKKFVIPVINGIGEANILLEEGWFIKLIKLLKLTEDVDILDIGVNVGQSLLAFRSCYNNTYWGFEPNPACVFYLDNLINVNNLSKVNIMPLGLSTTNSVVKIYHKNYQDSCATIVDDLRPGMYTDNETKNVPVFSFEELKLNINKIGLIKIDVEGAELDVISGMLETIKKHQPIIICEILDFASDKSKDILQSRVDKLLDYFRQMNYRVFRIIHNENKNLKFEEINSIELKQWTVASLDLNDYLFLPPHMLSILA